MGCSKPRAGAFSFIASVMGAIPQVAVTLVAKWKGSCAASGRTSKQTLVAMMVGLKTPQKFVVAWSMLRVLLEGRPASSAAPSRFVEQMAWNEAQNQVLLMHKDMGSQHN